MVEKHYDSKRTLLNLLPLATRSAGPRETLWHAIICRNYGANHLIVGDGHPGLEADSFEQPFSGSDQVQEAMAAYPAEIGVTMVPFTEQIASPVDDESTRIGQVSSTHPETTEILADMFPPRHKQGFCVWLTGLSCAGKSVTAGVLTSLLLERGREVTLLDGDVVRTHLSRGSGSVEKIETPISTESGLSPRKSSDMEEVFSVRSSAPIGPQGTSVGTRSAPITL